jgi:hypothetical protein
MIAFTTGRPAAWVAVLISLIAFSCSTGNAPQPGTPAFYWAAAKETFASGDYLKTIDNLERVTSSENEYTARALPWLLIMTSGMSRGYTALADAYEDGMRVNKADSTSFRRQMINYRSDAGRFALQFADAFAQFQKSKDENVPLGFSYPTGSAGAIPPLTKVANGILPAASELETAQKRALERGVQMQTCQAVGAPDDPAKTQEIFRPANVQVPRAVFVTAMARSLYDQSQLYGRTKLDDPEKMKIFCGRAGEALKTIPETKQTKELNLKIQTALKKAKV